MSRKHQNDYTDEFREQLVKLYQNGKSVITLNRDYGVSKASLYKWIEKYDNSGSFRDKDNRSTEENELIELRKENKRLLMENDILKQAALIMARK
jgi:transposase